MVPNRGHVQYQARRVVQGTCRCSCVINRRVGASTTVSTQAEHDALLLFISDLADNIIRAQMLNDTAAAMFLTGLVPDSLFVQSSELTPECYK